jgi:RNA recognition motif-containing protein
MTVFFMKSRYKGEYCDNSSFLTLRIAFSGLFMQILDTGGLYLPMRMTISGLPRNFDKFDLQRLFNPFGWVEYTKIIIDPLSGLSKGKGIVEMKQDDQAKQAMAALQGKVLGTSPLNIKETKEGGFKPW